MLITEQLKIDSYYEALIKRDPDYIGVFYVGVKTTGIFCISTCRARKPKLKNVEFYSKLEDLLIHGYRPCKICKPTENSESTPDYVLKALKLLNESEKQKVSDADLSNENISPEKIRRWFKHNHGITYQAYQRMIRINKAFQQLQKGKKVTDSAFSSGYESLSGFSKG